MRELAIVGDIHGDSQRLSRLLEHLAESNRLLIFVGDYVNRGADSASVLEQLCSLCERQPEAVRCLLGNHELALLDYLDSGDFGPFAALGGAMTIRSYVPTPRGDVHASFRAAFPERHYRFLNCLLPFWESEELLVSHAGYDPARPWDRSVDAMARRRHPDMFLHPQRPRPLVVCGHYVQRSGLPYADESLICVDTGCGSIDSGPLTALLLPERTFITA
jgi:serine/threonine protein phosphatase 1